MNLPRFFLPSLSPHSSFELSEAESHHLARVLRMQAGANIEVFDGKGCCGVATILSVHKNSTVVETTEVEKVQRHRETRITIATSLPKGDRQKWLIEKLTELGVDRVIPLETERGVAQPTDSALERLERVALEACKQSRNDWLLQIDSPTTLSQLSQGTEPDVVKLLAHPYRVTKCKISDGNSASDLEKNELSATTPVVPGMRALQQWLPQKLPREIVVGIGPEGGFTDEEVDYAVQNAWMAWVLTHNILRVETAVMMSAILAMDFVSLP